MSLPEGGTNGFRRLATIPLAQRILSSNRPDWAERKKGRPGRTALLGLGLRASWQGLGHASHAASAGGSGGGSLLVFVLDLGDEGFGGRDQARDGRCVLQRK